MAQHWRKHLSGGGAFIVNSSHQGNVIVLDDSNMQHWERGESCKYYGGFYKRFPAAVSVPHTGTWNLLLELPNGARYGVMTRG